MTDYQTVPTAPRAVRTSTLPRVPVLIQQTALALITSDHRVRSSPLNFGCYLDFHVADCLAKNNFHTFNLALFLQINEIDAKWNGNYRFYTVFRLSTAFL